MPQFSTFKYVWMCQFSICRFFIMYGCVNLVFVGSLVCMGGLIQHLQIL